MTIRRFVALFAIIVLALGGWWMYLRLLPRVDVFFPDDLAVGAPPFAVVKIEFSRQMEMESVIDRLTISPEVDWEFRWGGDRIEIIPTGEWPRGEVIQVELAAGAESTLGLDIKEGVSWSFSTAPTVLAYLWPSDHEAAIYVLDPSSGDTWRISEHEGVLAFDVDQNGDTIYYSALNGEGGADLYSFDRWRETTELIYECGEGICSDPKISFNGNRLAFTRTFADGLEVWVLEIEKGETERVSRAGHDTRLPDWSSRGVLSYYDVDERAYILVDSDGEQIAEFENQTGERYTWSLRGDELIAPEFFAVTSDTLRGPSGEADNQPFDPENAEAVQVAASQLLVYSLSGGLPGDLTRSMDIQDFFPVYSLDGLWIAFARKFVDEDRWTIGRQMWIMRAEGSNYRQLTGAPNYNYTNFAWHPDGKIIAAVRFNNVVFTDPPEIWLIDIGGGEAIRLVIGGYFPQWIP